MTLTAAQRRVLESVRDGRVIYSQFSGCMGARFEEGNGGKNVTSIIRRLQEMGLVEHPTTYGHGLGIKAGRAEVHLTEAGRHEAGR